MILDIFVKSEQDLNCLKIKNKKTNILTNYCKNKVHFICSKCNCIRTKAIQTLNYPFICSNCNNKTAQLLQETKDKIEKTCLEKYGYKHTNQVPKIRELQKKTYEKHKKENKDFVKKIVKKREQTYKNRTGYVNPKQNPTVQKHIEETCIKNYGVSNPLKSIKIQNKIKKTKKQKYGIENYTNRNKSAQTYHKHYDNNLNKQKERLNKMKKTFNEHYNCDWGLQAKEVKEKTRNTFKTRYGVEHPSQVFEIQNNKKSKYHYNNKCFDSSWELAFYIWLTDNKIRFEYHPKPITYYWSENGTFHKYYPDFKLWNNTLIEFKRPDLYQNMITYTGSKENAKYLCMVNNFVKIYTHCEKYEQYIKEKYGTGYLKQFKIK